MELPPPPARLPATLSAPTQVGRRQGDPAGELLGDRYLVGERLGSGGMAEVRRGHDQLLDRPVAIKIFRGQDEAKLTGRERAEAQLLASLDHPGLVKVHDVGFSPLGGWVVMDLVDGPDLHKLLYTGLPGVDQVWAVAHDVSRTLAYVHAKGITHRDVKPSNILTREAEPSSGRFGYVLTDFGIARRMDSERLTATGETIGTASYFSPEQARGEAVSAPTDIYALGLVLLECLTGRPAFEGRGLETVLARLHRGPEIPAEVNPAWRGLITRMTAADVSARPTAAEVAGWLTQHHEALLTADGGPPTRILPGAAGSTRPAFVLGLNDDDDAPSPRTPPSERPHSGTKAESDRQGRDATPVPGPSSGQDPAPVNLRPSGGHRLARRAWVGIAVVVVVVLVLVIAALSGVFSPAPMSPEPLPSVPGVPGERLSELYESVTP